MKPIPNGLHVAPVRVWVWDQFDDPFFGDVQAMVDRRHMDKSVPGKGTGAFEPADADEGPSITERNRIAYLESLAREKRENAARSRCHTNGRAQSKKVGRNGEVLDVPTPMELQLEDIE